MYEFCFVKPWHKAYLGRKEAKAGEIGLEIEVELARGFDEQPWFNNWRVDGDGSLRGHGYEFILNGPQEFENLLPALEEWDKIMKGKKYKPSPRTSVHVHYNMQPYAFPSILSFGLAYWLVEDWLMPYCGPSRRGNLFCLTNSSSDDRAKIIKDWLQDPEKHPFHHWTNEDAYKYSSFNFCTLPTIGSVEIRTMRGVYDIQTIYTWVSELKRLKDFAVKFDNPQSLLKAFVKTPKQAWINEIFTKQFIKEVNELHPDNRWQRGMDKAFFDLAGIANATGNWTFQTESENLRDEKGRLLPAPGAMWHDMGRGRGVWLDRQGQPIGVMMNDPVAPRGGRLMVNPIPPEQLAAGLVPMPAEAHQPQIIVDDVVEDEPMNWVDFNAPEEMEDEF